MSDEAVNLQPEVPAIVPEAPVIPAGGAAPKADAAPANGDQTPASEVEGEKAPVDAEAEAKRKQRQKEARLYRERAEQKARADLLEQEIARLRESSQPKPVASDGPKVADFTDSAGQLDAEKYLAAERKHAVETHIKEEAAKKQREQANQFQSQLLASYAEKAERGEEKYPDWNEKVGDIKPASPWAVAAMQADNAEDVLYHLATNRKEFNRIAGLDAISQTREIGKLEAKLLATPAKVAEPSKAPPPIKPVSGPASVPNEAPSDKDDIGTWMRKENLRVQKGLRQ